MQVDDAVDVLRVALAEVLEHLVVKLVELLSDGLDLLVREAVERVLDVVVDLGLGGAHVTSSLTG